MKKKKKKKEKNVQNESRKLSLFYITPFFLTNVQNKVGLHSIQPLMFSIFYITLKSPAGSLPFLFFLFYFLIHTRQVTRTPWFPLFSDSVLNFLSSLSFYVVFLFLLLFSCLCVFFNSSTYQCFISSDFSPLLTQVSHLGFFVLLYFFFVRYICLLHFFLLFCFLFEILVL